ncbi:MAG TPA: hypothetical protein PKD86_11045 [Gemmatales bacterium]|nr:hypothetical protein [Gemmatales bacterium]HMP59881.1 hypothetical protein [Gemmatales bacterium]
MVLHVAVASVLVAFGGLGLISLAWTRLGSCPVRAEHGRWLFVFLFAALGGLCVSTAAVLPQVAISTGLLLAFFLILMLWDGPAAHTGEPS